MLVALSLVAGLLVAIHAISDYDWLVIKREVDVMDNKFEWSRTVVGSDGSSATDQCSAEGVWLIVVGVTVGCVLGRLAYQIHKEGWNW